MKLKGKWRDIVIPEKQVFRELQSPKRNKMAANRVLAIDCIKKTMSKSYPVSSFSNGEIIDCISADFPDMEDLSPSHRKVAQERYTMIAGAVSVVDDVPKRNLMIEKSAKYHDIEIMLDYTTGRTAKLGEITPEWWIQ